MKGIAGFLLVTVLVLILAATTASALSNQISVDEKKISPGYQTVNFDGVVYRVFATGVFTLVFERVDAEHHRVFIFPQEGELLPCSSIYMQWDVFPPVCLDLGLGGGTTYLLGTETGYAEK